MPQESLLEAYNAQRTGSVGRLAFCMLTHEYLPEGIVIATHLWKRAWSRQVVVAIAASQPPPDPSYCMGANAWLRPLVMHMRSLYPWSGLLPRFQLQPCNDDNGHHLLIQSTVLHGTPPGTGSATRLALTTSMMSAMVCCFSSLLNGRLTTPSCPSSPTPPSIHPRSRWECWCSVDCCVNAWPAPGACEAPDVGFRAGLGSHIELA